MTQPYTDSEREGLSGDDDNVKQLQLGTSVAIVLLLMGLGLLSFVGWTWTAAEVGRQIKTATLSTATTAVTPTVTPGQEAASTEAITATATVTPTVTPTATKAVTLTLAPSPEAATFAAAQHFVTLAVLTATMVLFPWVLLLAFVFQRAPRLFRDLDKDLEALGLYRGLERMRLDLERELTKEIWEGFTQEFQAKEQAGTLDRRASEYAKQLASMALGKGTGPGEAPREIKDSVWQEVNDKARKINQRVAKEKEIERGRIGLKQRFGSFEFSLPLLSMTPIVLVSFVWVFWPQGTFGFVNRMGTTASLNDYFG